MTSRSPRHLLTLPLEMRTRLYRCYIERFEALLSDNEEFAVENSEPHARFAVCRRTPGGDLQPVDLHLSMVCHQIRDELLPVLAGSVRLHVDSHGLMFRLGVAHQTVIPQWYATKVQEIEYWESEIDPAISAFFPELKRVTLKATPYYRIPFAQKCSRWTKADVEKEEVITGIRSRALNVFADELAGIDSKIPDRSFCLTMPLEFGMFTVHVKTWKAMVGSTMVRSLAARCSRSDSRRKSRSLARPEAIHPWT